MARPSVDYEGAWLELEARILQRDGWGTRTLVTEMAHIRVSHTETHQSEVPASGRSGNADSDRAGHDANEDPKEDRDGTEHHPPVRAVA